MIKRVAVLGAGAWGTAISTVLADNGIKVSLWCYEQDVARDIATLHMNKKYLPDVLLSERITATEDLHQALVDADWVFEAIPVKYLRELFIKVKQTDPSVFTTKKWVFFSKGIEQQSLLLPSRIAEVVAGKSISYVAVGGPNFASELVKRAFTATDVASNNVELARQCAQLLANDYLKANISNDPIGVEIGGAIKNVLAITVGIAHGAGYMYVNTRAFLITQGLAETVMLTQHLGGKRETAYGLSGLGDIVLSCSSDQSKNFRFGFMVGKGYSRDEIAKHFPILPEGVNTLEALQELLIRDKLNLPLCQGTYDCVFKDASFKQILARF